MIFLDNMIILCNIMYFIFLIVALIADTTTNDILYRAKSQR